MEDEPLNKSLHKPRLAILIKIGFVPETLESSEHYPKHRHALSLKILSSSDGRGEYIGNWPMLSCILRMSVFMYIQCKSGILSQ